MVAGIMGIGNVSCTSIGRIHVRSFGLRDTTSQSSAIWGVRVIDLAESLCNFAKDAASVR